VTAPDSRGCNPGHVADKNELLFADGISFNEVPVWQRRGTGLYWVDPRARRLQSEVRSDGEGHAAAPQDRRPRVRAAYFVGA
jgi:tRNA(His) 5'-end guanylyltransferase